MPGKELVDVARNQNSSRGNGDDFNSPETTGQVGLSQQGRDASIERGALGRWRFGRQQQTEKNRQTRAFPAHTVV
jgi:hypothetical protein